MKEKVKKCLINALEAYVIYIPEVEEENPKGAYDIWEEDIESFLEDFYLLEIGIKLRYEYVKVNSFVKNERERDKYLEDMKSLIETIVKIIINII